MHKEQPGSAVMLLNLGNKYPKFGLVYLEGLLFLPGRGSRNSWCMTRDLIHRNVKYSINVLITVLGRHMQLSFFVGDVFSIYRIYL